jgi:3-methyladenine DNA glycosylase/8-oxoguanine DNA glycosylase
VVRALGRLTAGEPDGGPLTGSLSAAGRWRPWRSYATHHLWAVLEAAPTRTGGTRHDGVTAVTVNDLVNSY